MLGAKLPSARALPVFFKEFEAKYVKADSADEKDKAFAELVKTTKCNVCHVAGQEKKVRNAYGQQLGMLLKKDNFKAERVKDEADKVKAEIVAAYDPGGGTEVGRRQVADVGELIGQGKLPGGDAPPRLKPAKPPATPAPTTPTPAPAAPPALIFAGSAGGNLQDSEDRRHRAGAGDERRFAGGRFPPRRHGINDEGLALVKVLPKVVQLDLKDTQITDAGLANLAGVTTLVRLHLEKTKITDAGLAHLKDLTNLEYLNLYGTAVTNAGLEHLKGLKTLKKLYVWQSQVNDEGIAKLKEALPGVTVVK